MSTFNNEESKVNKLYGPGITEDDLFIPNKVRARLYSGLCNATKKQILQGDNIHWIVEVDDCTMTGYNYYELMEQINHGYFLDRHVKVFDDYYVASQYCTTLLKESAKELEVRNA